MDSHTDWMDRKTGVEMHTVQTDSERWMDGWTNGQTDKWMDGQESRYTDGWMDRTDIFTDGWMDKADIQMDGRTDIYTD